MEIKDIIERYKQTHNITDAKFASLIGVGESTFNYWQHGGIPRGDKLQPLLRIVGIELQNVTFPSTTAPQASTLHQRKSQRVIDGGAVVDGS